MLYKFVTLHHVHGLFGERGEIAKVRLDTRTGKTRPATDTNLGDRVRKLVKAGYLIVPEAVRRTRALSDQSDVYVLTYRGAKLLTERLPTDPDVQLVGTNWWRKPAWLSIDHEVLVTDVLVALRLATEPHRPGSLKLPLAWTPYLKRDSAALTLDEKTVVLPDGEFTLDLPTKHEGTFRNQYWLEIDASGKVNSDKMRPRFLNYFAWWKAQGGSKSEFKYARVLTIATSERRMHFLRSLAEDIGVDEKHRRPWPGFLFTTFDQFSLQEPLRLFHPVFHYADGPEKVSLLHPFVSS
jgi:hypothetical protein